MGCERRGVLAVEVGTQRGSEWAPVEASLQRGTWLISSCWMRREFSCERLASHLAKAVYLLIFLLRHVAGVHLPKLWALLLPSLWSPCAPDTGELLDSKPPHDSTCMWTPWTWLLLVNPGQVQVALAVSSRRWASGCKSCQKTARPLRDKNPMSFCYLFLLSWVHPFPVYGYLQGHLSLALKGSAVRK